jgi:hypothetical protein
MGTGYLHSQSWPVLARSTWSQDPSVPVASPHRASPSSPILSGRCACCKRKSRHDMAGFAKGMATTSAWTLVLCDCRNRIHQVSQQRVGIGTDEARWRQSEGFIARSPGCRQGAILAPDAAWQLLPSSKKRGPLGPWDILDQRHDLRVAARSCQQRSEEVTRGSSGPGEQCPTAIALRPRKRASQARAIPACRAVGARAAG